MKVCNKCGEAGEMSKSNNGLCKACHADYMRQYRNGKPQKRYFPKDMDAHRAKMREYMREARSNGKYQYDELTGPISGFVYVVKEVNTGNYKIGYTAGNLNGRLATMQTDNSSPLELVECIETDDARKIEARLQQRYASRHVRGEWYKLHHEDVTKILNGAY